MKFIKYILKCVIGVIDASVSTVGASSRTTFFDGIVGLLTLAIVLGIWILAFFILNNKTRFKHNVNILLSILITTAILITVCVIAYFIERIFNL